MKNFLNLGKLILIFTISVSLSSCQKEGTGGKSIIKGEVAHHENLISNALIYIKYGATDFPGADVSMYDSHVTADANGHYEIKDLRKGDYYLYGVGYDDKIFREVKGGIGVKLKRKETLITNVPVTED